MTTLYVPHKREAISRIVVWIDHISDKLNYKSHPAQIELTYIQLGNLSHVFNFMITFVTKSRMITITSAMGLRKFPFLLITYQHGYYLNLA